MKRNDAAQPPLREALQAVVAVLERHHVTYALTGGLALAQHGVIHATQDVDLLLSIPQVELPRVLDDLQAAGFAFDPKPTMREWIQHHMTQLAWRGIRVDWLAPVLPEFQDVLKGAVTHDLGGIRVRVVSAEGLILLKLIAFREQDKMDVQGLLAAHAGKLKMAFVTSRLRRIFEPDDPRFSWLEDALRKFGR
jgi:predicted nucleotidyltransferase